MSENVLFVYIGVVYVEVIFTSYICQTNISASLFTKQEKCVLLYKVLHLVPKLTKYYYDDDFMIIKSVFSCNYNKKSNKMFVK